MQNSGAKHTKSCSPKLSYRFLGEIASNWPIHQFEKNVLVASAHIQSELSVPVIIHPGRNAEAPFEVMRIFAEAGGNCQKTVMSHLDSELMCRWSKAKLIFVF